VSRLVTLLPASDGVAVFDSRRFLNDALPRVLASNQPLLGKLTAHMNEVENKTGIDLRRFDQVAVGVTYRQVNPKETDYDAVLLASGDINAAALVTAAKSSTDGTVREEKVGTKTMYVFTPKALMQKTSSTTSSSKIANAVDNMSKGFSKEFAIATVDRTTVAIGTPSRVRETLLGGTHTSAELNGLLAARADSMASFAGRVPSDVSGLLPVENDDLGANIQSIQLMAGTLDVTAVGATVKTMARTKRPEQASALKDTLDGLQSIFGAVLGNSKKPDQQVYARMVKSAKFTSLGNEVNLDLTVPQADIDALIGGIK
jgi:hypothetical protein